ncbi:hypothetical protein EDC01DRAFT_633044 [Geopyxis carbonaria]|nr:hypothetical protein EDC01DRAFT_633044 [Geopyxis carbonaria]
MDEAYDSPDSDGHGSIPSPDTTFNLSRIRRITTEDSPFDTSAALQDWSDDESPVVITRLRRAHRPTRPQSSRVLQPKTPNSDSPLSYHGSFKPIHQNWDLENSITPQSTVEQLPPAEMFEKSANDTRHTYLDRISTENGISRTAMASPRTIDTQTATNSLDIIDNLPEAWNDTASNASHSDDSPKKASSLRTGLPRSVVLRKNKSTPADTSDNRQTSLSSTTACENYQHKCNGGDATPPCGTEHNDDTTSSPDDSCCKPENVESPTAENSVHIGSSVLGVKYNFDSFKSSSANRTSRNVSGMTLQNETFDEINPCVIQRVYLSSERQHTLPSKSSDNLNQSRTDNDGDFTTPIKLSGNVSDDIQKVIPTQLGYRNTASETELTNVGNHSHSHVVDSPTFRERRVHSGTEMESWATYSTPGSAIPEYPYSDFDLSRLKQSKSARRMSMNTPPSHSSKYTTVSEALAKNPPSVIDDSEYRFPLNLLSYPNWHHATVSPDFAQLLSDHRMGTDAPPNSIRATPNPGNVNPGHLCELGCKHRLRSHSDPLNIRVEPLPTVQKMLFTPTRLSKVKSSEVLEQSSLSLNGSCSEPETVVVCHSAHEQSFSLTPKHTQVDQSNPQQNCHSNNPNYTSDSPNSLKLGDVEVRVQTPSSVRGRDTKYISTANSEGVNQLPTKEQDSNCLMGVTSLEDLPESLRWESTIHKSSIQQVASLASHNQDPFTDDETKQYRQDRSDIPDHLRDSEDVKGKEHDEMIILQGYHSSLQTSDHLYTKTNTLKNAVAESDNVQHSEMTLKTMISPISNSKSQTYPHTADVNYVERIAMLEQQLEDAHKRHQEDINSREAKFENILQERDAEVNHLQAELDEMANLMPVDHFSRIGSNLSQDDLEADFWTEEKSRDLSNLFEDSLDQIITEIQGNSEREDYDQATAEAETSLRKMAANAGFGQVMDKASLAAFGIRQLREENIMLKRLVTESEERVEQFIQSNATLVQNQETLRTTILKLKGDKIELENSLEEYKKSILSMRAEIQKSRVQVTEKTETLNQLTTENIKLRDSEEQLKLMEKEYANLKSTCLENKQCLAQMESQVVEAEQKIKDLDTKLRGTQEEARTLANQASILEINRISGQKTISELRDTVENTLVEKRLLEAKIRDHENKENEVQIAYKGLIRDLDSLKGLHEVTESKLYNITAERQALESQFADLREENETLQGQRFNLETTLSQLKSEYDQTRTQFDVYTHESVKKETTWNKLKDSLESELHEMTAVLHESTMPYERALSLIRDRLKVNEENERVDNDLVEELITKNIAKPELVASVIYTIKIIQSTRWEMDTRLSDLEAKNERLKMAIRRWGQENAKEKGKSEKAVKDNVELMLRLKAEKKQSDEKIGSLILALRR